jgi:hypothetical protein
MTNEIKEITLSELLETDFTINENMEMVGTFTLDRINMISDILTNLQEKLKEADEAVEYWQEESGNLQQRIDKAVEYCNNNIEFTPRLIDVIDILRGDE